MTTMKVQISTKHVRQMMLLVAISSAMLISTAASAFATGSASVTTGKVIFTAGAGDTNSVQYEWDSGYGWEINDIVDITPGTGCTSIDSNTVHCGSMADRLTLNLGDQDDNSGPLDPSTPNIPTFNGGDGNDSITASNSNEIINGDAGNDQVYAGDGNDTINGGSGDDMLYGEGGNDAFDGGTGADGFGPGSGTDTLTYASRTAHLYVEVNGYSGEVGEGDVISSADSFEVYTLGSGDDDFYGAWNNVLFTVNGGNGHDNLYGSNSADVLNGGYGNDTYRGYAGNDTISPHYGADDIRGDGDFDTVSYASLPLSVNVTINDVANDGYGSSLGNVHTDNEKVIGTNAIDNLTGQAAAPSTLFGGYGSDTLTGGSATDTIDGSSGDDIINPGGGSDTVTAGSGNDTVTANDGAADTVDCGSGTGDKAHADTTIDALTGCETIWWY